MNNGEARRFLERYFHRLYVDRDLSALDDYLHQSYYDGDIGPDCPDHVAQSKEWLAAFFRDVPTVGVDVRAVSVADDVITAYLEWFHLKNGARVCRQKGVGVFVMENGRVRKRHNYIYFRNEGS